MSMNLMLNWILSSLYHPFADRLRLLHFNLAKFLFPSLNYFWLFINDVIALKITTCREIIQGSELLFWITFTTLLHCITCLYKYLITKNNLSHTIVICDCTKKFTSVTRSQKTFFDR